MVEAHSSTARADVDIAADIEAIIQRYPPLVHDRPHLRVSVSDGVATVAGHLRSLNTRDFFLQALATVDGLKRVDSDFLHVDELVRLALGQVLPVGVIANTEYGTVVLSGRLPEAMSEDAVVARAGSVPGVRRVVVAFRA
jgi:osmotically-inducible protein OsmY